MREGRDDLIFMKSSLCVGETVQVLGTVSRNCLSLIVSVSACHAVVPCPIPAHGCSIYNICNVCVTHTYIYIHVCIKNDEIKRVEEGKNKM